MNIKGTNIKRNSKSVFNYSDYLREYYFRMAAGLEKVPSNAELALFMRKLNKVPNLNAKIEEVESESIDDILPIKLSA